MVAAGLAVGAVTWVAAPAVLAAAGFSAAGVLPQLEQLELEWPSLVLWDWVDHVG